MSKAKTQASAKAPQPAEVLREYGPFQEGEAVHGVSHDGSRVWFATGKKLRALDPARGELVRELDAVCDAGTAFDGDHLYQLGEGRIHKLDPHTGNVIASYPTPAGGGHAGLTWAEGKLWLSRYSERKILQLDPETGEVLKTIQSDRFVTGVTWVEGDLWHATFEDDVSELRQVSPEDGEVLARLQMPAGSMVSGLEWDGAETFYCGGGRSGKVRAVRKPRKG